jgi:hypothetical protein
MRTRWLASLLVLAIAGGGALASAAPQEAGRRSPGVRLTRVGSCAELLAYGRGHALPLVGPYGLGDWWGRRAGGPRSLPAREVSPTNLQEAGVDEPDLVKADGSHLFAVAPGSVQIVSIEGRLRHAGRLVLPANAQHELLLHGDRLLVLSHGSPPSFLPGGFRRPTRYASDTTLLEVDVSRPRAPRVVRSLRLDGTYIAARMVGGVARVVTVSSLPEGIAFDTPHGPDEAARAAALARNRDLVQTSGLGDWLPHATLVDRTRNRTRKRALVQCRHVWRPAQFSGLGLVTVATVELDGGLRLADSDALIADAEIVYASRDALYLATERWRDRPPPEGPTTTPEGVRTTIHKFDTGGAATRYRGSGTVEGYLLNQWSLSEYRDVLRVASTQRPAWWSSRPEEDSASFVTSLAEREGKLVALGRVGGLGKGEQIHAVRFIGDMGYVVTFRVTDPLYTIDLSRPGRPAVRGALHLLGYSAYLHPVGPDLLLGVGQEATEAGVRVGIQLSLFDVSDHAKPRRIHHRGLGRGISAAEVDHHAFLYWPPTKTVVLPVRTDEGGLRFSGALAYRADRRDGFQPLGRVSHDAAEILRSVVADDSLYTVSSNGVKENALRGMTDRGWVAFPRD